MAKVSVVHSHPQRHLNYIFSLFHFQFQRHLEITVIKLLENCTLISYTAAAAAGGNESLFKRIKSRDTIWVDGCAISFERKRIHTKLNRSDNFNVDTLFFFDSLFARRDYANFPILLFRIVIIDAAAFRCTWSFISILLSSSSLSSHCFEFLCTGKCFIVFASIEYIFILLALSSSLFRHPCVFYCFEDRKLYW